MTESTGLRVPVIASMVTLGCSTVCSAIGIYAMADGGAEGMVGFPAALPMILVGIAAWVAPPMFLLRSLEDRADQEDLEDVR